MLILSLFPGVDLLGRAFTSCGFSVVRGPDLLDGQDIRDFHGAAGFEGIIAGTPCQDFSKANRGPESGNGVAMLKQFLRVVSECRDAAVSRGDRPPWFLLENVPCVPDVALDGYQVQRLDLNHAECGGATRRRRHIQFGHTEGWILRPQRQEVTDQARQALLPVPLASSVKRGLMTYPRLCRDMDLPGPLSLPGRSDTAKGMAAGNGVPLKMGVTLALGVISAAPRTALDCECGCGRTTNERARHAGSSCRQRVSRRKRGLVTRPPVTLDEGTGERDD